MILAPGWALLLLLRMCFLFLGQHPIHQRASSIQVLLNPTSDHRPLRVSYIFNYVLVFILIIDRDQGS